VLVVVLSAPSVAAAQEQVTICHRTGSATNPWVFMTIDARLWPEYQAQGDMRAMSLAECSPPTPAPVSAVTRTQPAVTLAQPAVAQAQPAVAQNTPAPIPTPAPPTAVPTPARTVAPTPAATIEVAGAQAAGAADAQRTTPEVSSLPKGGGEPNRPLLVLGLLGLTATGLMLRRLAKGSS
jgi:hypothetical protein